MPRHLVFLTVLLVSTMSLSGCLRGNGGDGGVGGNGDGLDVEPGQYEVLFYEDLVFASGLAHTASSTQPSPVPLKLDVYCPDSNSTDRPVLMFIHGGGFTGGVKHKPEIVEMGQYLSLIHI